MPRMTDIELDNPDAASDRPGAIEHETLRSRLKRLEAEVVEPARRSADAETRLRRIVSGYAALAIDDPGAMALLADDDPDGAESRRPPEVRERVALLIEMLESDLAEAFRAQNRASKVDPKIAALSLLGIIHWGIRSHRAQPRVSRDEAIEQITLLALHGLTPRPSSGSPFRPQGRSIAAASPAPS